MLRHNAHRQPRDPCRYVAACTAAEDLIASGFDADMYCHRPFDFDSRFVFGWEKAGLVCNASAGAWRQDSKTLAGLLDFLPMKLCYRPNGSNLAARELEKRSVTQVSPSIMTAQEWGFTALPR